MYLFKKVGCFIVWNVFQVYDIKDVIDNLIRIVWNFFRELEIIFILVYYL